MYTLFGVEAKEGDFVLIQDVAYMSGSADIRVARVYNGKAYAASAVPCKGNSYRWIRKEKAITVISAEEVLRSELKLIEMNIQAEKSTFTLGTDYAQQVWEALNDAYRDRRLMREKKYGQT